MANETVPVFVPEDSSGGNGKNKTKKPMRIRTQIAIGFGIFVAVTVVMLWVLENALLSPFYKAIKTGEVKNAAESVVRRLEDSDLDAQVKKYALDLGVAIIVSDEHGVKHSAWKSSERECFVENLSRANLEDIFNDVNFSGGSKTSTYDSPFVYRDGSKGQIILYGRVVRTAAGQYRLVLIESEITPVDSVVETLQVQLICVIVIMAIMGAVLAYVIARKISRPAYEISEDAKLLASGSYDIRFKENGAREISDLARTLNYAAEELSKVERLRRELLANVSHDLRTPLTMIRGYAEVMRDLPGENTPENVQIIIDETARLTDLVNDLLDLSKLDNGVVALERTVFSLTDAIRDMLRRYEKLADYTFTFVADTTVFVYADELKISQVVYNLVNNAINYAGEDKTITLRQTASGNRVRISVSDTGEGIPADKLKDIWERYYKVDKEHRRAQIGTGLGLAIVKNILDLHGGAYGVESEQGKGSTFWFELDTMASPIISDSGASENNEGNKES